MSKNKKIIAVVIILIIIFMLVIRFSKKAPVAAPVVQKNPISVSVQTLKDSSILTQTIEYPAITAGDQEITLTARASGTITRLNFDLGSRVGQGTQIATIDTIGNFSKIGDKNLKSSDTEILDLAVDQADQAVKLAKANYDANKTKANKRAINIAEIQLDSARVARKAALDTRFVVSPISGVITGRVVSLGDSVSVGQTIATISKTALTKVQFFVNQEDLPNLKIGMKISIAEDGKNIDGTISRIAPEADPTTKRFLVEARPAGVNQLLIGSVINISFSTTKSPSAAGNLILPLSAISIGQNESHIFIVENDKAKLMPVTIENVQGEFAEIKVDLPADAQIIINGSKLVQEGEAVAVGN
jgi:multidrug efflux system membrane fusion protein